MTTNSSSRLDLAMAAAREYARLASREGSRHARALELREEIDTLVGRWADGQFVLPLCVVRAMEP